MGDSKVYIKMMQFMNLSKETETKWALFRHSFTCFAAALSREHDSRAAAVEIQFCMVLVCNSSLLSMVKWNTMPHTHENHVHHEQVGGQATIELLYSPHGSGNLSLWVGFIRANDSLYCIYVNQFLVHCIR